MKTLLVLLLVAAGIGAAYWKTQRPGEGLDALRADMQAAAGRLGDGVAAVRNGGADASADGAGSSQGLIAAAESNIDALDTRLNARIDAIENQLTGTMTAAEAGIVESRLEKLEQGSSVAATADGASTSSNTDLDAAMQRMEALEGKLDLLTRRQEESDPSPRIDELDAKVTGLAEVIQELSSSTAEASEDTAATLVTLEERLNTNDTRVAALAASGAASGADGDALPVQPLDEVMEQRIAALESNLETARATALRIEALDERFESLGEQLDADAGSESDLRQTVASLEEQVAAMATRADALSIDNVQQEIREQLASLDAEVGNEGPPDVVALNDSLEATRRRIQTLEARVQNLPASASEAGDAQQTQSALEAQIAALERRVETLPATGTDPALVDSISEVRQQVNELSTQDFVTQEELRAQTEGENVEYKIYFDKNSVAISSEAAQVLDSFVAQETNRTTGVAIFGFTDRAGPALYNQQLAQRRAEAVRSYLIQNGFDYTKIGNVAGLGEDAAAALLEDEQEDAQQRVVVLYAAQR